MVTTKIDGDGAFLREIYAKGDSAFLSGDMSHNPYMFNLDSNWRVTLLDTADKYAEYNVKISKTVGAVDEFVVVLKCDEDVRPLAAPVETFEKRFRWFYSYYTFKTVYPCISEKILVAIDEYMNKDEQKLWFQGDISAYAGMTGMGLKDRLDDMEEKFVEWFFRNVYEACFNGIMAFEKLSADSPYVALLPAAKDIVFQILVEKNVKKDVTDINYISTLLDTYFNTTHFSDSYKKNAQKINKMCEEYLPENLFSKRIEYKLIVPGKLVNANAPSISGDTLTWKVMAINLIPDDYELTATSRSVNIWAFVVVFFLIVLSVYCLRKLKTKRVRITKLW
jgi:hypothetical protein